MCSRRSSKYQPAEAFREIARNIVRTRASFLRIASSTSQLITTIRVRYPARLRLLTTASTDCRRLQKLHDDVASRAQGSRRNQGTDALQRLFKRPENRHQRPLPETRTDRPASKATWSAACSRRQRVLPDAGGPTTSRASGVASELSRGFRDIGRLLIDRQTALRTRCTSRSTCKSPIPVVGWCGRGASRIGSLTSISGSETNQPLAPAHSIHSSFRRSSRHLGLAAVQPQRCKFASRWRGEMQRLPGQCTILLALIISQFTAAS